MAKKKTRPKKKTTVCTDLFGPPSILIGEIEADYNTLTKRVTASIKPTNIIEEFAVRDVVSAMWDSLRLSRLKTALLNANMHKGLKETLVPLCNPLTQLDRGEFNGPRADTLSEAWMCGEGEAIEMVDRLLAAAGLTMDAVVAQTMSIYIDDFDRIDRMAMNAEARRHVAVREIDRRRQTARQNVRPAVPYHGLNVGSLEHAPVIEGEVIDIAPSAEVEEADLVKAKDVEMGEPDAESKASDETEE
jgi:hypothetical protein